MARKEHIDDILRNWPYEPDSISVRLRKGKDGREVIQMRVDLGVLQMETTGRPDGTQPEGSETYYDHLIDRRLHEGETFSMDEDRCSHVDREFLQYYHRRICWLALREYRRAVEDADHTLSLMDFCRSHADDPQWVMSHEQYRPFVLFHRTQAAALADLEDRGPRSSVRQIERGLKQLQSFFSEHDAEEHYAEDELVVRLSELRESLLEKYDAGFRLRQQLADAVAAEKYELAARIRDKLARLGQRGAGKRGH